MITWLASYPRSGNTLFRTILNSCFDIQTYDAEVRQEQELNRTFSEHGREIVGAQNLEMPWEEFYPLAAAAPEMHFVKVHRAAVDQSKVIYVVRDGRKSVLSYLEYHAKFTQNLKTSLNALIMGLDYYGSWTSHYRSWKQEGGCMLLLRYEDIVQASPELLRKVGDFIGQPVLRPWNNPFEKLHELNPEFFRQGISGWGGDARWTPLINGLFFHQHGELMLELGYASQDEIDQARATVAPEIVELCGLITGLQVEKEYYRKECDARLKVIDELDRACKERLRLIERLSAN